MLFIRRPDNAALLYLSHFQKIYIILFFKVLFKDIEHLLLLLLLLLLLSFIIYHLSFIIYHLSFIIYHLSFMYRFQMYVSFSCAS